jgi:hypothetical protein
LDYSRGDFFAHALEGGDLSCLVDGGSECYGWGGGDLGLGGATTVAAGAAAAGAGAAAAKAFATAAPETAAPSRAFIRFDTSCLPPNDISPSPTTKAGEYAPKLMLSGTAMTELAKRAA